jgi:hypothetical protein
MLLGVHMCVRASVLQVGLLQEDKVDPEEVARQHTIDWLNRCAQHSGCAASRVSPPSCRVTTSGQAIQQGVHVTLGAVRDERVCMDGDARW